MPPKRPSEVRRDLNIARAKIVRLIADLENASETPWDFGTECGRAAGSLQQLVSDNAVPDDYRVAVIGRFKAGKSAFVNELLRRRLAG